MLPREAVHKAGRSLLNVSRMKSLREEHRSKGKGILGFNLPCDSERLRLSFLLRHRCFAYRMGNINTYCSSFLLGAGGKDMGV